MTLAYAPVTPVQPAPSVLNAAASPAADRQLQVAGEGAPLRIVLGTDCIGAQVGAVWWADCALVVCCIWARGPAGGVASCTINDEDVAKMNPALVGVKHYTGAAGQGVDPWLKEAAARQTPKIVYTDTLPGIAYSVFKLTGPVLAAPFAIKAVFNGLLLHDPRRPPGSPDAWSDNAGLALRAFLREPWGEGKTITGGDVAVADRCDEMVGIGADLTEKRCRIGLTLDARQTADQWRETLRTYAECFVVQDGNGYMMIPDAPALPEYTYSHAAGNLLALGNLKRATASGLPTAMTVWYTDRSATPWKDKATDTIKRPGVDTGLLPWRPQEIRLNGIFSPGQALRVAITRLNKLWLCDLSGEIHTADEGGVRVRPGTVVTLSDPRGIAGKKVRVLGTSGTDGRYTHQFVEHDNAAYSNAAVAAPSQPDTDLPGPFALAAPTGLAAKEKFVFSAGGARARLLFSWAASADRLFLEYLPEYQEPGTDVWTTCPATADARIIIDDALFGSYALRVRARNTIGAASDYSKAFSYTVNQLAGTTGSGTIAAEGGNSRADVTIDALGNALITFAAYSEPQILAYELRCGATFEGGAFVAQTTGTTFTLPVLGSAGKVYWIRARYETGYSIAGYRIDFSGANLAAPGLPTWSIAEPNLVYTWGAVAGAAQYLCLFEVGGVTTVKTVATPGASFPIPKYAATLRIVAMAADGTLSPFVDEELGLSGQYKYNEIVNVALPLATGKYLNMAFTAANTVKRASLLGNAPVAPYAENINDGDLYSFGYNLQNLAASGIGNISASWFRNGFWREKAGYFESAVVDLGAVLTGSLTLNLTKTVTYVGNAPVSGWAHVAAGYLADADTKALTDQKAFLTAKFFIATDSPLSATWKEAANGDWITARYVKIVVEVAMASPLTEITVTAGAITIDVPDVSETGSKTGVTSAGAPVAFTRSFNAVSCVIATARGAAKAYTGNITASGCTLYADVGTQQVDYFVKGY